MADRTQAEREFEESVHRASERYRARRRALEKMERKANEGPEMAIATALHLAANARAGRRLKRRYLWSRFGIKVHAPYDASAGIKPTHVWSEESATLTKLKRADLSESHALIQYAARRHERAPRGTRERLLRTEAVREQGGYEALFRAVRKGLALYGPSDWDGMACKLAFESLRQGPALWAFFVEESLEPDERVREYAVAELTGWLDAETRLFGRTREAVGGYEEKLRELAAIAAEAWYDLRPGEPFYLPNRFVQSLGQQRKKGSLAGRAGSLLDGLPEIHGLSPEWDVAEGLYGSATDELEAFVESESDRQEISAIIEKAQLSDQEHAVVERKRRGEEVAAISTALGIPKNQVGVIYHRAVKKMRKAAVL